MTTSQRSCRANAAPVNSLFAMSQSNPKKGSLMPQIDLDCAVAEELGYQCLPDGRWVAPNDWQWLKPHERGLIIEEPPPFASDLNWAWKLLDGSFAYTATLSIVGHLPRFGIGRNAPWRAVGTGPEMMAEAICRAWLDYKDKG